MEWATLGPEIVKYVARYCDDNQTLLALSRVNRHWSPWATEALYQNNIAYEGSGAALYAAAYGRLDILKYMVAVGTERHQPNFATVPSDLESTITEAWQDLKDDSKPTGWTPIHLAALFGHEDIVETLLDQGVNLETKDNDDHTPLLYGLYSCSFMSMTRLLTRKGADINDMVDKRDHGGDHNQRVPMIIASCKKRQMTLMIRLILAGADVSNVRNGRTLLHEVGDAINHSWRDLTDKWRGITKMLVCLGVDRTARDTSGQTALHRIMAGFETYYPLDFFPVADDFLPAGTDPSILNDTMTPMLWLALKGRGWRYIRSATKAEKGRLVSWFVRCGGDINIKGPDGRTCLHWLADQRSAIMDIK
ncbi:Uu.00g141690.m01.CDS01 [Anthostomella pinea]|uniref:Uu.00g141690.m01.CDS01 n=1 Tax=Anthostomella pinea TaxID=933095 RepID=A0AAI8VQC0_9PEZI|nr:Uu.00g141690.m01.CDS01 [Anthostomella pinea]